MTIVLRPGSVSLGELQDIYWNGTTVRIDPSFDAGIEKAAARIAQIAAGNEPVYGINTGFGKLASIKMDSADISVLQRNLILSHCCGVGAPLAENIVRLIMALKLVSPGRGASGVRGELVRLIEAMLEKGVELRAPLTTSPELQKAIATIRSVVTTLEEDRYMANDLKAAADLMASGGAQRIRFIEYITASGGVNGGL